MYRPQNIGRGNRVELVIAAITLASVVFLLIALIQLYSRHRALRTVNLRVKDFSVLVPGSSTMTSDINPRDKGNFDLQVIREPPGPIVTGPTAPEEKSHSKIPTLDTEPNRTRYSSRPAEIVYEEESLDTPIVPLVRITPRYPPELKEQMIEGSVVALISVDEEGHVYSVKIEKSEHQAFADSVATALLRWRFLPGRVNGRFVKFKARQPMRFRLVRAGGRGKEYANSLSIVQ